MKMLIALSIVLLSIPCAAAEKSWSGGDDHRLSIEIKAGGVIRIDRPVEVALNAVSDKPINFNSLRVVELDGQGQILDETVPFQFDAAPDVKSKSALSGSLDVLLQGKTAADAVRHYQLYFRSAGKAFTAQAVAPRVTVTDNVKILDGMECFKIQTLNATYIYGKDGAGFASIIDRDGNDWISYSHTPKAAGEYHGLPKFGHPEKLFHAGYKGFTSVIQQQGPLKVRIYSEHADGKSSCTWDFYPTFATITLHKFKLPSYWFLYEGTPAGKLDVDRDFVVRSNGKKTLLSEPWTDNVPWVYFGSGKVDHALFMASHQKHDKLDSYVAWPFEREADGSYQQMTVFGFGRKGYKELIQHIADLTELPARYTIGFTDELNFEPASKVIESAYRPIEATAGPIEMRLGGEAP
jgi:hypothetical protein